MARPPRHRSPRRTIPGAIARVQPGEEMKIVDWLRRVDADSRIEREWDDKTGRSTVMRHGGAQSIFTARDARDGDRRAEAARGQGLRGHRHPARRARLLRRRAGEPAAWAPRCSASRKPYYVRTAALVTNLGVHFKLGRESSLVWVTRLADGKPVKGAQVNVRDCARQELLEGRDRRRGHRARRQGAARRVRRCRTAARTTGAEYFVTARVGDDLVVRVLRLGRRHRPVALQPADRAASSAPMSRTRCSTARSCAPARRCR